MLHLDLNPTPAKLRQFGWIAPVMLVVIGGVLMWRFNLSPAWPIALGGFGLALFLLSRISPALIRPVYIGLVLMGFPIGWVVSHLVMMIFFFGVVTPIALIFRLAGRDLMHRRLDPTAKSYWTEHLGSDTVERYFRQF